MKESDKNKDWFAEWFDTPYYHLLYKHRNFDEAALFISNLLNYLQPDKKAVLLDACCGKGRHALYMNKAGFSVDAFDLSENNIRLAQQNQTATLHFYKNDIRTPLFLNKYDVAFNLFTSFGYFENEADNITAIKALSDSIKPEGVLVMDFLNAHKTIDNMVEKEQKKSGGTDI